MFYPIYWKEERGFALYTFIKLINVYYNTAREFYPMGKLWNICARNLPPCLLAEFLALCLSQHGMHRFGSSAMYNIVYKEF